MVQLRCRACGTPFSTDENKNTPSQGDLARCPKCSVMHIWEKGGKLPENTEPPEDFNTTPEDTPLTDMRESFDFSTLKMNALFSGNLVMTAFEEKGKAQAKALDGCHVLIFVTGTFPFCNMTVWAYPYSDHKCVFIADNPDHVKFNFGIYRVEFTALIDDDIKNVNVPPLYVDLKG